MSTAAAGLVLSIPLVASPAFAANECGAPVAGVVTCTSTSGTGNPFASGIKYTSTGAPITVNADNTVNATGPLIVTATGGNVTVNNAGTFDTGTTAVSAGIGAQSTGGAVDITHTGSVTTDAANTSAIIGIATGNTTITSSGSVAANGTASDGIDAISTAGTTAVNITSGSVTGTEFGVGLEGPVAATQTATLTNAGTLTGGKDAVFTPSGSGAASITNSGVMNGAISLNGTGSNLTTGNVVNNSGTWNVSGDSNFGPTTGTTAPNVFNNSGTLVVDPNTTSSSASFPSTVTFSSLSAFNNSGAVDVRTGNNLNIGSASFNGLTGSQLLVNANGPDGVLTVNGSSGSTAVTPLDVLGNAPGQLNLNGTLLVQGANGGTFNMPGGGSTFHKGFVDYDLVFNPATSTSTSTYILYGLPGREVFEALSIPMAAQTYWKNSAAVWTQRQQEIRDTLVGSNEHQARPEGWEIWMAPYGGHSKFDRFQEFTFQGSSGPPFTFDSIGTHTSFFGLQAGADVVAKMNHGYGYWGFTGGVEEQETDFIGDVENNLYLIGGNIGMYGGINWGGLYLNGLGKVDFINLNANFNSAGFSPTSNWRTYGTKGEIGYRFPWMGFFVEPSGRVAAIWTNSNDLFPQGAALNFNTDDPIMQGQVGGRVGTTLGFFGWQFTGYGGAFWEDQWRGRDGLTFVTGTGSGATAISLVQRSPGSFIHAEYGLETGDFYGGLKGYLKGENDFNGEGVGGWMASLGFHFDF